MWAALSAAVNSFCLGLFPTAPAFTTRTYVRPVHNHRRKDGHHPAVPAAVIPIARIALNEVTAPLTLLDGAIRPAGTAVSHRRSSPAERCRPRPRTEDPAALLAARTAGTPGCVETSWRCTPPPAPSKPAGA
ncbi:MULTISPECIES: hypothetical protein [unclassified Streptomyces]|uniref:hypothetical protein n=1 Tax=unclassified Streptomyces TaxID=2593676 RepID=UPI00224FBF6A|nr:hypothetical protein [Streptomyces sp. NBC_00047]MCX5613000.1 hypothetical protein [Streptomyces sp. NBC_00047]